MKCQHSLRYFPVSAVTDMWCMFDGAAAINQPLEKWNGSAVTKWMFGKAAAFSQPTCESLI